MSWLDRLLPPLPPSSSSAVFQPQIDPWVDDSHLADVQLPYDLLGVIPRVTSRREAMAVPAVARARHLTAGTIAGMPLEAMVGETMVAEQPGWCQASDGQTGVLSAQQSAALGIPAQSCWARLLWTVDDLLFSGVSLWAVTQLDADKRPARMARVNINTWQLDETTGAPLDQDGQPFALPCVLIDGPHEGILRFAANTIATAADLETSAAKVAKRPFRIELHQTSAAEMDPEERRAIVRETKLALDDQDGILFTNNALETIEHKIDSAELLLGARNTAALDIARHVSMPAAMIDATTEGASLEYATLTGRNQQWLDYGLSLYINAVTARLSMDDVVPRGQRVALDTSALTALDAPDTGAPTQD